MPRAPGAPAGRAEDHAAASDCREPLWEHGHLLDHLDANAKTQFPELIEQLLSVHEINRWCAIPGRFGSCITAKRPCSDHQAAICATDHGPAKVADRTRADTS